MPKRTSVPEDESQEYKLPLAPNPHEVEQLLRNIPGFVIPEGNISTAAGDERLPGPGLDG